MKSKNQIIFWRCGRKHLDAYRRRLRRCRFHLSGVPFLHAGRGVCKFLRFQPFKMADGSFRLHGNVVRDSHFFYWQFSDWLLSRVKNSRALHRTFCVDPLYLRHEKSGDAIDYMVSRILPTEMLSVTSENDKKCTHPQLNGLASVERASFKPHTVTFKWTISEPVWTESRNEHQNNAWLRVS